MTMRKAVVCVVGLLVAGTVCGHHAMEYIEMESYATARAGEYVFHLHYDYMVDNHDDPAEDHWECTPGLSVGITDRVMLDVHTHFAKFGSAHIVESERAKYESGGPSPFMEAAAASLQVRVVQDRLVDIAVIGTIEVPFGRAEMLLGSEDNVYAGMLVLGRDFGAHGNVTVNLGYEQEGNETDTTWALGVKSPISSDPHGIAAGIELMGSFSGDNWSVLPGVYMPLGVPNIVVKTGFEFGEADGAATTRANVTMMVRF